MTLYEVRLNSSGRQWYFKKKPTKKIMIEKCFWFFKDYNWKFDKIFWDDVEVVKIKTED